MTKRQLKAEIDHLKAETNELRKMVTIIINKL